MQVPTRFRVELVRCSALVFACAVLACGPAADEPGRVAAATTNVVTPPHPKEIRSRTPTRQGRRASAPPLFTLDTAMRPSA